MNKPVRLPRDLAPLTLRAGVVTLRFEPASLWLRDLSAQGTELVRAVYPAVRDTDWSTAEPAVSWVRCDVGRDRFSLALRARYGGVRPWFEWTLVLEGSPDNSVRLEAEGTVLRPFRTNRTGLCVLHPAELAGRACTLEHTDGRRERSRFPREISPHQPFFDLRAVAHRIPGVGQVEVRLEGDTFETEDQRNWTDASFKTYSRPLARPFPYALEPGNPVRQRFLLAFNPSSAARSTFPDAPLHVGPARRLPPHVGLRLPSSFDASLAPARYFRVDLDATSGDAAAASARLQDVLADLPAETGLELALRIGREGKGLETLARTAASGLGQREVRWLVLAHDDRPVANRLFERLHAIWRRHGVPGVVGAGVAGDFVALNRHPLVPARAAFVAYGIDAQVHAFDERSILETLTTHPVTLLQARKIASGRPVVVSPATFGRPRRPGRAAAEVDPRQGSPLAAVWTLGCLAATVAAGAQAVTFDQGGASRGGGNVVLALLDAWHTFPAERVAALPADHRRGAVGVALQARGTVRLLLGNLRPESQTLRLAGLPAGRARATLLCAASAASAGTRRSGAHVVAKLPGYAVLQLDFPAS